MARPRKTEAKDTKALALKAADALLHAHGYSGVSMDAVARTIGVRKASLYHHFPEGKEQLVMEFAQQEITFDALAFQRALEANHNARARLLAIAQHITGARRETAMVLQDSMRFLQGEHQRQIFGQFYQEQYLRVKRVFDDGVSSGELKLHDTEFSAWAFMGLMSEMNRVDGYTQEELAARVVELLMEGVAK